MRIKIDPLDRLFSQYIRMRAIKRTGGCERCLRPKYDKQKDDGSIFPAWKQLDCAHFHSRRTKSVRYDEDNAIGVCKLGCHQYLDSHPLEKVEFFKKRLGETAFDLLTARACIHDKVDEKAVEIYLKNKIKELESEYRE